MASGSRRKFAFTKRETETCDSVPRPSTPTMSSKFSNINNDEYSPCFIPCTQEVMEKVDVLWDWNSPQSKPKYARKKRVIKIPSPKPTVRRAPLTNKYNINKLQQELMAVHDKINQIEDTGGFNLDDNDLDFNDAGDEMDRYFNDSIDEELMIVSQQIEKEFIKTDNINNNINKESPRTLLHKSFSSNALEESPVRKSNLKPFNFRSKMQEVKNFETEFDDSLDSALSEFNEDKFLPAVMESSKKVECDVRKFEVNKSPLKLKMKSLSFGDHYDSTRDNMQKALDDKVRAEIERKRQIALAKLNAKKKHLDKDDASPIKCSPDEIEEKRRQALAKLEARKKQEVIERNRQEALKRLEMNRKKRAFNATISKK